MSIEQFEARIGKSKVGKADREWFPKWLRRHGATVSGSPEKKAGTELSSSRRFVVGNPRFAG